MIGGAAIQGFVHLGHNRLSCEGRMLRSAGALRRCAPQVWRILGYQKVLPVKHYSQLTLGSAGGLKGEIEAFRTASLSSVHKETRGYAKEAEQDVEVPIDLSGIAGKYATCMFVAASRGGVLDQVESELKEIGQASVQSPEFAAFVEDISIPKPTRVKVIRELFGDTNFSDYTKNFLAIMAENGRLKHLKKVAECFEELMLAKRGHVKAVITSAEELSSSQVEKLKADILSKQIKPGETLFIEQKVDENIIGGVVIDMGDKHIDLSIANRIRQIEKVLLEAV